MKNQVRIFTFGVLLPVFSSSAFSCSPVDNSKLIEFIVHQFRLYWFFTALIGIVIIYMSRKGDKKGVFIPLTVLTCIVFHPSWTSSPMFTFNCTGQRVLFSRLMASTFVVFLIYETYRVIKDKYRLRTNHTE